MAHDLSPQSETYLHQMVTGGLYPSTDAALEAAVEALREKNSTSSFVPDEHMAAVEEALAELEAGVEEEMAASDWDGLRQVDSQPRKLLGPSRRSDPRIGVVQHRQARNSRWTALGV